MSTLANRPMTNNHEHGFLAQLGETLQTWRQRAQVRRELSQWTERDMHDVGVSWSDVLREAEKPFWRA